MKNLIVIEDGESFEYSTLEELVKDLISKDYYTMSDEVKNKKLIELIYKNIINMNIKDIKEIDNQINEYTKNEYLAILFLLKNYTKNEYLAILFLLKNNVFTLLENIDSNIFVKYLNKANFDNNYIIVNKYAEEILEKYIGKN